jgi:hypothetical protein
MYRNYEGGFSIFAGGATISSEGANRKSGFTRGSPESGICVDSWIARIFGPAPRAVDLTLVKKRGVLAKYVFSAAS